MENMSFEQLVKERFNELSPGQKKVAEYLVQQPEEAVFSKAAQIGRKVEVSETTVIRLSYALGFSGFTDMQEKIQRQLFVSNHQSPIVSDINSSVHFEQADREISPYAEVIENEILYFRQMIEQLKTEEMDKVVDRLIQADQILIAGFGASYAAANWFSYTLGMLRENVEVCHQTGEFYQKICNLTEKSAVVVLSFPRYSKDALHVAECAKKQGIPLISVTDRMLSPVGRISDITLTTNVESDSIATIFSFLFLIIEGINHKDKARIQTRQQKLEQLYSSYEVFIE